MKKLKCNGKTLELYGDKGVLLRLPAQELLSYSVTRPFDIELRPWKEIVLSAENSCLTCYDDRVRATLAWNRESDSLLMELVYENISREEIVDFAGNLVLPIEKENCKITIPHLIYNDNPSADPAKVVPHVGTEAGGGIVVEEHRLPVPAVNVEWKEEGEFPYLTLCTLPKVTLGIDREYWSIGVLRQEKGVCVTLLTGPLMFNGMKDVVYGGRCAPLSYQGGYRTLQPGEKLSRRFSLDFGLAKGEGKGFRSIIKEGYRLFAPQSKETEDFVTMIDYKLHVADSRFCRKGEACGYLTFGSANHFGNISGRPDYFLYGWTGQTLKLAWCECLYGLKTGDEERICRGCDVVDFYVRHAQAETPGLLYGYYLVEQGIWSGGWKCSDEPLPSRILGEAVSDVLDVMLLLKEYGREIPYIWEERVRDVCVFLMEKAHQTEGGIYPFSWSLDGTVLGQEINASGMPCVVTLAKAYEYFGDEAYLSYAKEKYNTYAHLHMDTFDIPFARATMDARCEDKEAGIYFFLGAWLLFRLTGEERYREWAAISADWILTFVFFWNTGFRPGTPCHRKGFDTTGWPGVSVQNHHLDVFFPSYELYAFGKAVGEERFETMGRNIRNAMTQGICTERGEWGFDLVGEQGEHYYHTNYFQSRYPGVLGHLAEWRGGSQVWNPSWITAQVLQNNLLFWRETWGEENESNTAFPRAELPLIPNRRVSLMQYGAQEGVGGKNTEAFRRAVDDLAFMGGGVLVVPPGMWVTGPVRLRSHIELHLERGAYVVFSYDREEFPLTVTNYEGTPRIRAISPVSAQDEEDVAITGEGILDGNGEAWRPVKQSKLTPSQWSFLTRTGVTDGGMWFPSRSSYEGHHHPDIDPDSPGALKAAEEYYDYYRPVMVSLVRCRRVLLEGVTFQNSPAWNLHPLFCEHVTLSGLTVRNPWYAQNGDGLDLESCRYVEIRDCGFDVGDDAICLKAGKNRKAREIRFPTEYVTIEGCTVYHGHGGFVVGSEMSRGVRHVRVKNCTFIGTDIGVRIKSTLGRGGVVEDIHLSNIRMKDITKEAVLLSMRYSGALDEDCPDREDIPEFRDIHMDHLVCDGAAVALAVYGLKLQPIHHITMKDCVFRAGKSILTQYVKDLTLEGVEVTDHNGNRLPLSIQGENE